jgi:non-ribosomal peptide synthetase component F
VTWIYIGGPCVALGYFNNPELTQQKFLPDPFHPPWKMYKTGDSAMYLPNGCVEVFGRLDQQVKIRGYRVELGEIDAALLRHTNIKEAVTTIVENIGHKLLVACIILK